MEEEFYSTIKLSSGEEIIAKVCYLPEENSILIENPKLVDTKTINKNGKSINGFVLKDWINSTYENMFIIPRSQIITMIELDSRMSSCYEDHLEDRSKYKKSTIQDRKSNSKRQNPRNHEGYLGSIKEAKKLLEEIYNKS